MKNKNLMKNLLPQRLPNSHKGSFGHVLNVSGSFQYRGAAYLSSVSALKVGCGLVTLASDVTVLNSVSALSPDIILLDRKELKSLDKFDVVSIGCGLSLSRESKDIFKRVLNLVAKTKKPLVIDADGLNILSEISEGFDFSNVIFTPHPKELSRLLGVSVDIIIERPDFWAKKCCEKFGCITVLKGHKTVVASPEGEFYENNTGNSSLAHGGSGDVLCGMISGFLAQKMGRFEACCLAVYLHGLTGEIASKELTEYSVLASDLLGYIPNAIRNCRG